MSPKAFFEEQVGHYGNKGPLSFVLAYSIVAGIINVIGSFVSKTGAQSPVVGLGCGWLCTFIMVTALMYVAAGINHGACKIFGGTGDYAATFRATAYGQAPQFALGIIASLLISMMLPKDLAQTRAYPKDSPQVATSVPTQLIDASPRTERVSAGVSGWLLQFPQTNPGMTSTRPDPSAALAKLSQAMGAILPGLLIAFAGYIWTLVVTGIGYATLHELSTGKAVGAVLVSELFKSIIVVVISVVFSAVVMGAIMGAMGAARH